MGHRSKSQEVTKTGSSLPACLGLSETGGLCSVDCLAAGNLESDPATRSISPLWPLTKAVRGFSKCLPENW